MSKGSFTTSPLALHLISTSRFETILPVEVTAWRTGPRSTLAVVAGVLGSLIFPPFGGLVAALLGLFAVELYRLRDWRRAMSSTRSMAIGCGWAAVIRFGIGTVMILLFLAWMQWG